MLIDPYINVFGIMVLIFCHTYNKKVFHIGTKLYNSGICINETNEVPDESPREPECNGCQFLELLEFQFSY